MDGALYAYNLDGMEIYDFTLYDNLEIPVWNEGGECGGCGDPEGYGAPLEAAGEEPGLIGQWISTELKNQSGQNITYGMYFGDYQYFEFQYGQMGHDLECWSGTFEVTDQFRNGEFVVHYVLYTPDGIREGEFLYNGKLWRNACNRRKWRCNISIYRCKYRMVLFLLR